VSQYQKGKTNLDFLEQEIISVSGIGLAIFKSAPSPPPHCTNNHANTPPLSFLEVGYSSCCPTNSVKALMAYVMEG